MMELNGFEARIADTDGTGLFGRGIDTLQVNLGLRCNQHCAHCHLDAGPQRRQMMDWPVMEMVLEAVSRARPRLVDLTGGAPELAPHFRRFVESLCQEGLAVQVRTNLTVLLEPGMDDLPEFFRRHRVRLFGSLPCYMEENVGAQRGKGVYEKSIATIKKLNALGYGSVPRLPLNLVYNPGGAFLPPPQAVLEEDYRRELGRRFGITFTHLLTITNMVLGRFKEELARQRQEEAYSRLLRESFNPGTVPGLMCRHQLSVGWDGTLYDCDFNLALGLPVNHGAPDHVSLFKPATLRKRRIVTGEHCFGCAAGAGSSCGGSIVP
ncbi:MAG: arsenosugar biosynthesis radical SAM (seleno)protein ArsS [Syntrophorhabdales bacterium]|jgi:radical SAM/Cys-rich protein